MHTYTICIIEKSVVMTPHSPPIGLWCAAIWVSLLATLIQPGVDAYLWSG
ncbi:MAG: hypothetical protein R3E31_17835 [Chloroflexota bacterium]